MEEKDDSFRKSTKTARSPVFSVEGDRRDAPSGSLPVGHDVGCVGVAVSRGGSDLGGFLEDEIEGKKRELLVLEEKARRVRGELETSSLLRHELGRTWSMPETQGSEDGMSDKGFPALVRRRNPQSGDGSLAQAPRSVQAGEDTDMELETESDAYPSGARSKKRKKQSSPEGSPMLPGKSVGCRVEQLEDSLGALEKWMWNEFKKTSVSKDSRAKLQGVFANLKRVSSELVSSLYYLEGKVLSW